MCGALEELQWFVDGQWVPGRPGIVNVPGTTAVVINTSRLALIFAAMKTCTFSAVALLQSATVTGHSSGGREWVWWRELGGVVSSSWLL